MQWFGNVGSRMRLEKTLGELPLDVGLWSRGVREKKEKKWWRY